MPPINSQGSRAGLITALVIFTVLFVTSTIFAIYFNVQLQDKAKQYEDYKKNYNGVVADTAFTTPQFAALKTLTTDGDFKGMTVLDVALKQRDDLAAAIKGTASDAAPAIADSATTLASAKDSVKKSGSNVALPPAGLTSTVNTLVEAVGAKQAQVNDLTKQLADAQKALTDTNTSIAAQNAQRDKALEDAKAADAADLAKVNDSFKANSDMVAQLQKDQKDAEDKSQAAAQGAQTQLADAQKEVTKLNTVITTYKQRLGNHRPDVTNAAVRQADGKIIRIPNEQICYINLGQGDQVSPGLTFEVYDRAAGVPAIPDNVTGDEQLPAGKASIEITRISATSSECRIVHLAPGAVLSEGDLIENLIYDPRTKYNFFVFGNFDLAETGRPNAADTEVIKRLVTQWGAKLTDQVNVDTDFVVLGKEPVLPNFSKEELEQPLNADKLAKAQAESDKYQEMRQTARELHIPILNQNRFLYYVGYYDQAKQ